MTPIVINTIIVCSIALFIGVVGYILSQPHTEIKKGIFHVGNAEIKH